MNAHKKHLIKQALRKAKCVKGKRLTNKEMVEVRQGKITLMELTKENPKENWKPKTKEPESIGSVLGKNK